MVAPSAANVLGTPLQSCCMDPLTGFYRNGRCDTGSDDVGLHLVCAEMTEELAGILANGNSTRVIQRLYQNPSAPHYDVPLSAWNFLG